VLREFRDFAMRGNVVDLAVGVIIGAAFGTIVSSLVDNVVMPPIGLLIGGIDFSQLKIVLKPAAENAPEVAISYGLFINAVVKFLIVAWVIFLVVKAMNSLKKPAPAAAPVVPEDTLLLREIRDALKRNGPA
jgi:large conductance mechanosensitive channel